MNKLRWLWPKVFSEDLFKAERIFKWPKELKPNRPFLNISYSVGGTMAFENAPQIKTLLDTGADAAVIISPSLAKRLGATRPYTTIEFQGMAGKTQRAAVVLVDLKIGGITLVNVPATVTDIPGKVDALLGNVITNLFSVNTIHGVVHLQPNENFDKLAPYQGSLRAV